jgi:hypothetical protein
MSQKSCLELDLLSEVKGCVVARLCGLSKRLDKLVLWVALIVPSEKGFDRKVRWYLLRRDAEVIGQL